MLLRVGPYGDGFGRRPGGLTLAARAGGAARHRPRTARSRACAEVINTESGAIELAPPTMLDDLARLRAHMARAPRASCC